MESQQLLVISVQSLTYPTIRTRNPAREAPPGTARHWNDRVTRPTRRREDDFVGDPGQFVRSARMARVEAVLLISNTAITTRKLAQLATLADAKEAKSMIDKLNYAYDTCRSSFRIERIASGYRMLTRPELVFWLDRLHQREARCRLTSSMLETLTIVAYQQPITRADIEGIRGVAATEMLKQLMERGLVRIAGHEESLGRPYLYGTTRVFLEMYGLRSLDDLPNAAELRRKKVVEPPPAEVALGEGISLDEFTSGDEDESLVDEEDEDNEPEEDEDEELDDDENEFGEAA